MWAHFSTFTKQLKGSVVVTVFFMGLSHTLCQALWEWKSRNINGWCGKTTGQNYYSWVITDSLTVTGKHAYSVWGRNTEEIQYRQDMNSHGLAEYSKVVWSPLTASTDYYEIRMITKNRQRKSLGKTRGGRIMEICFHINHGKRTCLSPWMNSWRREVADLLSAARGICETNFQGLLHSFRCFSRPWEKLQNEHSGQDIPLPGK